MFRAAAGIAALAATVYLVRAFDARGQLDFAPEHRVRFDSEFRAKQEAEVDWAGYRAREAELAAELHEKVDRQRSGEQLLDRHLATSRTHPSRFASNWNHSYVLSPSAPRGAAVLLHGLTDSPYTMRATAQIFVEQGFHAVALRLPGHGFAVGGLVQAEWEDWAAAVRIAVRHAESLLLPGQPLVLVGYSTGGLLAVYYALECGDASSRCPDRLVLLSPAIAVTPFAYLANLHRGLSWLPYFEKFMWQDILPELDPFKFTSFPKQAGWQTHRLAQRTHALLEDPERAERLPPTLTFQSVVDDTISTTAVLNTLYAVLPENGSELVVYDVNRNGTVLEIMRESVPDPTAILQERAPLRFSTSVLSNRARSDTKLAVAHLPAGATAGARQELELEWPLGVFSLSHIALPFRPDDAVYGDGRNQSPEAVPLGSLAPRGERTVLALGPNYFLRLRHNPFYEFQQGRIRRWLEEAAAP